MQGRESREDSLLVTAPRASHLQTDGGDLRPQTHSTDKVFQCCVLTTVAVERQARFRDHADVSNGPRPFLFERQTFGEPV